MIGRKAAVGLSLLCALVLCAFAAQSASAKGTTAFTCVKVAAGLNGEFKDAHCDTKETTLNGYNHEEIKPGTKTLIDVTNAKTFHETSVTTPAILRGEVAGLKVEIECTEVTGKATIENKEIEKVMQIEVPTIKTEFTKCTVLRPENTAEERHPCKVAEPIVVDSSGLSKENLGAGGKEMGMEFKGTVGEESTTTIEFRHSNEVAKNCALASTKAAVTGTAIGTANTGSNLATIHTGATVKFTNEMTVATLKLAAKPAEFYAVLTPTMYNEATKTTENPISATTTQP